MAVIRFPKTPRGRRTDAKPGDLIIARRLVEGDWWVLLVASVDDDGFVATVSDLDGHAVARERVFERSTDAAPQWIISRDRIQPSGIDQVVGLAATDLDDLRADLQPWKADA